VQPQSYPGRGLSRTTLVLHLLLLAGLGVLTVVPLVVGGVAWVVALWAGVGMVLAIGVLVYRVARSGGSLKITRELMAFEGERIYFRDIEAVERGRPDRANQTFRVEVRTREKVHRLDLMDYRMEPGSMPSFLEALRHEVATRKSEQGPGAEDPTGPSEPPVRSGSPGGE